MLRGIRILSAMLLVTMALLLTAKLLSDPANPLTALLLGNR